MLSPILQWPTINQTTILIKQKTAKTNKARQWSIACFVHGNRHEPCALKTRKSALKNCFLSYRDGLTTILCESLYFHGKFWSNFATLNKDKHIHRWTLTTQCLFSKLWNSTNVFYARCMVRTISFHIQGLRLVHCFPQLNKTKNVHVVELFSCGKLLSAANLFQILIKFQ